jgi:hypothetical protein
MFKQPAQQPQRRRCRGQRSIATSKIIALVLCVTIFFMAFDEGVYAQDGGSRDRILEMDPTGSVCVSI